VGRVRINRIAADRTRRVLRVVHALGIGTPRETLRNLPQGRHRRGIRALRSGRSDRPR
jgi:hypothetical protein